MMKRMVVTNMGRGRDQGYNWNKAGILTIRKTSVVDRCRLYCQWMRKSVCVDSISNCSAASGYVKDRLVSASTIVHHGMSVRDLVWGQNFSPKKYLDIPELWHTRNRTIQLSVFASWMIWCFREKRVSIGFVKEVSLKTVYQNIDRFQLRSSYWMWLQDHLDIRVN